MTHRRSLLVVNVLSSLRFFVANARVDPHAGCSRPVELVKRNVAFSCTRHVSVRFLWHLLGKLLRRDRSLTPHHAPLLHAAVGRCRARREAVVLAHAAAEDQGGPDKNRRLRARRIGGFEVSCHDRRVYIIVRSRPYDGSRTLIFPAAIQLWEQRRLREVKVT